MKNERTLSQAFNDHFKNTPVEKINVEWERAREATKEVKSITVDEVLGLNCDFCTNSVDLFYISGDPVYFSDKSLNYVDQEVIFNFCPMCGRKL